jgi:AbrB family looped-hinge helix DNA binding protein
MWYNLFSMKPEGFWFSRREGYVMATILERSVVLDSEGRISIPKEIRDQVGLASGAQLGISSLAGLIILYRGDKDLDAFDVFARFGQLLREEGYDTSEKIDRLVKEIKRETTEDWLRRCRSAS